VVIYVLMAKVACPHLRVSSITAVHHPAVCNTPCCDC